MSDYKSVRDEEWEKVHAMDDAAVRQHIANRMSKCSVEGAMEALLDYQQYVLAHLKPSEVKDDDDQTTVKPKKDNKPPYTRPSGKI